MIPVSEHVVCFRANNPSSMTHDGTNCYVVAAEQGALLIDAGPDEESHVRAIAHYILAHGLGLNGILLTHTHSDHTDALEAFRRMLPAPVYAYKAGYDRSLRDGERIALEHQSLTVVHTPGHSGDSVCFYHEADGVLFTGDTVLGSGTSVISPAEGDVGDYLDSLERLQQLPARLMAPGHGPIIGDPQAKLAEYIEHRAMRERQIIAQLRTGQKTIGAMVEEIYKDVDPALHGAAAYSVRAHLKRMERLGQVQAVRDVWRLTTSQ